MSNFHFFAEKLSLQGDEKAHYLPPKLTWTSTVNQSALMRNTINFPGLGGLVSAIFYLQTGVTLQFVTGKLL